MTVTGRVLDPQGKPVPNAAVMVYAQTLLRTDPTPCLTGFYPAELGRATSDGSGRFRVDVSAHRVVAS